MKAFTSDSNRRMSDETRKKSAAQRAGGRSRMGGAICRIKCYAHVFDVMRPYNKTLNTSGVGTGFVLQGVTIPGEEDRSMAVVTAYHVVDHAVRILVSVDEHSSEPVEASLLMYNHVLDLAVLKLPIAMPAGIVPMQAGDSDDIEPNNQVQALGFALGADILQFTVGYISGRTPENIQIDAAINGGNSGGPLINMDSGKVLGIVVSGYNSSDAQNINYACPLKEALRSVGHMMEEHGADPEHARPISESPVSLSAAFDAAASCLTDDLGAPRGAYCRHVHEASDLHAKGLREGDILVAIGASSERDEMFPVDLQGRIQPTWWNADALPLKSLVYRLSVGDEYRITFWSTQEKRLRERVTVRAEPNLYTFRLLDLESEAVPFAYHGGLVVQPVHAHLLKRNMRFAHKFGMIFERPHRKVESLLAVTFICPECPFTNMETVAVCDIITRVDGASVRTLEAYEAAWKSAMKKADDACIVLELYDARVCAATVKQLKEAEAAVKVRVDAEA